MDLNEYIFKTTELAEFLGISIPYAYEISKILPKKHHLGNAISGWKKSELEPVRPAFKKTKGQFLAWLIQREQTPYNTSGSELLNTEDLAEFLGISLSSLYRYISLRLIPPGPTWRKNGFVNIKKYFSMKKHDMLVAFLQDAIE